MADDFNAALMKNRFYEQLEYYRRSNPPKEVMSISDKRYQQILEDIPKARASLEKTEHETWLLKTYDILNVKGVNKLIYPNSSPTLLYLSDGELFDAVHEVHVGIGHVGRERMGTVLRTRYKNINRNAIELYLKLCEQCQQKPLKSLSRAQITLIDFQTSPDGEYNYLLVYQDLLTKFIILKPLITDRPSEVAYILLDIFSVFGAPAILNYYNNIDYIKQILEYMRKWPTFKIVYGNYKGKEDVHMENTVKDVKAKLMEWMRQNNTPQWSIGVAFIQLMKNKSYNYDILQNPYKGVFGNTIKLGIEMQNSCSLLTEEDLERFLGGENKHEKRIENKHTLSTLETITTSDLGSNVNISESVESKSSDVIASETLFDEITCSDSMLETLAATESLLESFNDSKSIDDAFCTTETLINNVPSSESVTNYYSEHKAMANMNVSAIESVIDMYSTSESITMATTISEPILDNIVISDSDINTYNNSPQSLINSLTVLEPSLQLQPANLQTTQIMNLLPLEPASMTFPNQEPIYNNISTLDSIANTLLPLEQIIDFYPNTTNDTFSNSETVFNNIPTPHDMTIFPSTNTLIDTSFEANIDTYSQSFMESFSSPETEFTTQIPLTETIPDHASTDIFTNNFSNSEPIVITIPGVEPNLDNNISLTESTINTIPHVESNINMTPSSNTTIIPLTDFESNFFHTLPSIQSFSQ